VPHQDNPGPRNINMHLYPGRGGHGNTHPCTDCAGHAHGDPVTEFHSNAHEDSITEFHSNAHSHFDAEANLYPRIRCAG
jgi:hypothetical protein